MNGCYGHHSGWSYNMLYKMWVKFVLINLFDWLTGNTTTSASRTTTSAASELNKFFFYKFNLQSVKK